MQETRTVARRVCREPQSSEPPAYIRAAPHRRCLSEWKFQTLLNRSKRLLAMDRGYICGEYGKVDLLDHILQLFNLRFAVTNKCDSTIFQILCDDCHGKKTDGARSSSGRRRSRCGRLRHNGK
jgi:hypothetical protein